MTVNNLAGTSEQSNSSSSVAPGIAAAAGASRSGNGSHNTASSSSGGGTRPKLGARQQGQPQAQCCGGGGIVIEIIGVVIDWVNIRGYTNHDRGYYINPRRNLKLGDTEPAVLITSSLSDSSSGSRGSGC